MLTVRVMTIHFAVRFSRSFTTAARTTGLAVFHRPSYIFPPSLSSPPSRLLHDDQIKLSYANPVAIQMINYALSLSRSQKSDESYAQGLLVLEQCLSSHSNRGDEEDAAKENSMGMVLLAMSSLLSERGNFDEAIEKLGKIQDLTHSSLGVRVATMEALVGLHLELGQDDTSSVLADRCLNLLGSNGSGDCFDVVSARAKAVKGLVELVRGNTEAAESFFQGAEKNENCSGGTVALSYGEFLHANRKFSLAKELYQNVIQGMSETKDFSAPNVVAACNMSSEEVLLAATCALGQLEGHMGNFGEAEEILTRALTKTEEHFGSSHPKVGVILTCIALMFRQKATLERSSALLIQEGLYRRAIEMLKAPPLEATGSQTNMIGKDIAALARGGYAEVLCIQQNRKDEGERIKSWAEAAWRNRHLSLAEALEISDSSPKVPVIDARIARVL